MKKFILILLALLLIPTLSFAANKYAVASGLWSATATWSDTDGGAGGAAVPADEDAVFISAAVNVQMDTDLSAYTGLFTVTIRGGATPGMLYFKDGTSGYLKIRTGYNLVGTTSTNRGRLLANSDGTWRGTLGKGTVVTGSASADTLTASSHGLADTTLVSFYPANTSAVLPAPLISGKNYYVRDTATDTFKVALTSGGAAIDLTTDGTGTFSVNTCLAYSNKAVIDLGATSSIVATNLDISLNGTEPTNRYVETYGVPFVVTFANATEKFTIVSPTNTPAIPPNGTPITLSGTLPAELTAGTTYFVKAVSGATGELEATIGGGTIAISDDGSGTIYMHYGKWGPVAQATEVNTTTGVITWNGVPPLENVPVRVRSSGTLPTGLTTHDLYYVRTISGNTCKLSLISDSDTGIVIPSAVGSGNISMYCGSTYTTSKVVNVIQDVSAETPWVTTATHNRVVLSSIGPQSYVQLRDTLATIGTRYMVLTTANIAAQYPCSRLDLVARNISVRSNCTTALSIIDYSSATTLGGIFQNEIWSSAGIGVGNTTFYGIGLNSGTGHTVSGSISGCSYGLYYGIGHTISGSISGCSTGIYSGTGYTVSGSIRGCSIGLYYGIGHTVSGSISGSTTNFVFGNQETSPITVICRGASLPAPPTFSGRNTAGVGSQGRQGIYCEDFGRVPGASKAYLPMGDITKVACGSGGGAPSVDPDGGTGSVIEAGNLQSNLSVYAPLTLFDNHHIWLDASAHTITYKTQNTFTSGITAGNLKLTANYVGTDDIRVETHDDPALAIRTNDADWAKTVSVTLTPHATGWVTLKLELMQYESGKVVYVWPTPTVSGTTDVITPIWSLGESMLKQGVAASGGQSSSVF